MDYDAQSRFGTGVFSPALRSTDPSDTIKETEPPELDLVRAVVRQGIVDLTIPVHPNSGKYPKEAERRERERKDADKWFRSEATGGFSFLWCCLQLGYDAEQVRRRVLELPRREYQIHGKQLRRVPPISPYKGKRKPRNAPAVEVPQCG